VSIANNKNTRITLGFILSALEMDVDDLVKKKTNKTKKEKNNLSLKLTGKRRRVSGIRKL